MPTLNAMHKDREQSGIMVIGVHTPGTDPEDIRGVAERNELEYPVYVDTVHQEVSQYFGAMSAWYGIREIPQAVVVDHEGKVAAHGPLGEVLEKARSLAAAATFNTP